MKNNIFSAIKYANDSVLLKIEQDGKGYVFETQQEALFFFKPFYDWIEGGKVILESFIKMCYIELISIYDEKRLPFIQFIKGDAEKNRRIVDGKVIHEINVKGYFNKAFRESQTGRKTTDVSYGYGKIIFYGTEEELDKYRNYLVDNEGKFGFKLI